MHPMAAYRSGLYWLQIVTALGAVCVSPATASDVPLPPPVSSFLGAGVGENGVFSLLFSKGSGAHGSADPLMANTLFSGMSSTGYSHVRPAFNGDSDPLSPSRRQKRGNLTAADGSFIQWDNDAPGVVTVSASFAVSISSAPKDYGATFAFLGRPRVYGVWEYPWNGSITNNQYGANLTAGPAGGRTTADAVESQPVSDIGIYGTQPGINWCNARAPFFFADHGIGVYVDTSTSVTFEFHEPPDSDRTNVTISSSSKTLTYRILFNQAGVKALLGKFAAISSYPLMPPESAYGPIFWSDDFEQDWHDSSVQSAQDNINDVANHLEQLQIRATAFFADRPYGSGNMSFGNFDFDPKFYPSPAAFIANLTKRGYDFQVWAANRAFLNTQLYNDSAQNHWLYPSIDPTQYLGPALNLSVPEAYDYFRKKLTGFVSAMGTRGFKIDRGEEREMPDEEQNQQQSLFLKLCDEVMRTATNSSYYNFARSAFDRDRSRVGIWNGDSQATFEGLAYSVASGIRAGLLGFSHWGSDTGGYIRDAGGPSEELFARWMHFSTWSPMYEIMVGLKHTPWYQYSPQLVAILRQTAQQHTGLIPYLRSFAYEAALTGVPVIRALFLEFPDDATTYDCADTYMLGDAFLVAPILSAGGNRTVRFPTVVDKVAANGTNSTQGTRLGHRFVAYENKTAIFAPGDIHEIVRLPIESTPVYVREGSIVPLGDVYQGNAVSWATTSGGKNASWTPRLVLEVFPSFAVPTTTLTYYRGGEAAPLAAGPVNITMTADLVRNRTVTVRTSGDLGAQASVVLHQRSRTGNRPFAVSIGLPAGNQTVVISGLLSLFE